MQSEVRISAVPSNNGSHPNNGSGPNNGGSRPNNGGSGRIVKLIKRTLEDLRISAAAAGFALRHGKGNGFFKTFFFRKAIEIQHISPFRRIFGRPITTAELQLPYFGNARLVFDFTDPFQMAICEEFVKYNIYDLDLIRFEPDEIIDGGAYRGYFTFLARRRFHSSRLTCVEPHPGNFKELKSSLESNKIGDFTLYNNALSKSRSHIQLEIWGSNTARFGEKSPSGEYIEIATLDLTDLLKAVPAGKSLLLKVDIEGSELDFFPQCIDLLPAKCAVFLETHDGWTSLNNIKDRFESAGFKFSVLRDRDLYIDSLAVRE
jgi:FkbM family methyltransferase